MACRFRTSGARERAKLLHEAEEARAAGRAAEADALRAQGLALMSCWERALYETALHYESLGRTLYQSYVDDFAAECIRGCGSVTTYRRVHAEIMDAEPWSASMTALIKAAREGKVGEMLSAGDGIGDRDVGAMLGGAR